MNEQEQELIKYINEQFPATVGHLPLVDKIHAVWRRGLADAEEIAWSKRCQWDEGDGYSPTKCAAAELIQNAIRIRRDA